MRSRWWSRRAVPFHLALIVWFPGCLVAGWWQVNVALSGNDLAYLYSVEWPVFALFGVVVWWNLIHDDPDGVGRRALVKARAALPSRSPGAIERRPEEEDPSLAAYNNYLASLAADDKAKGRV